MADESIVKLTITFVDPSLDAEELNDEAQRLLRQLKELDEVETVERVLDSTPPEGNKSVGGFLVGLLTAEISVENFKKLMRFLGDRLGNQPMKYAVKAPDGREIDLEASSREEMEFLIQRAEAFLKD